MFESAVWQADAQAHKGSCNLNWRDVRVHFMCSEGFIRKSRILIDPIGANSLIRETS